MSQKAAASEFRLAKPSIGVTVLEASAGTGKTYRIAALASLYVAEGTPLDRLLLVTFTRMATGELRERVRERIVTVERELSLALAGIPPSGRDEVVELLAEGAAAEVRARRDRLALALTDFDAATITTTHGFCQEVLAGLGVAGDVEREVEFVEDISGLVEEVVDDLYLRRFHGGGDPPFRRSEALDIVRMAINNPTAPISPATGQVPEMRRRLALAAREELDLRKRRMAVMTFDDLLTRLQQTLSGEGGEAAAARLRTRYAVVLVDEFQDTDPVQWDIVRKAFGGGGATLVLIGDPKQAIYAFRGADVYAYLEAAKTADTRQKLEINWRSDQGLIDAYDVMFGGAKLGHEGILYRRVRAADANQSARLLEAPGETPVRIRVLHRDDPGIALTQRGFISNGGAREHIAKDLAADLVALLSSSAQVEIRDEEGATSSRESVRPGHIGVLVRTNRNAALIRDALDEAGIPAVINGAGSVFATTPAADWLRLLEAIERPTSPTRARSAALTCFFGWTTERVASADEDAWEEVHRRLYEWARVLRLKGVASLMETITLVEGLPRRILATEGGERWLTDLRHIGQLLHAAASSGQLGATALTAWLRRHISEAMDDTTDEERSRRLESDAEAVQVLTIHRSKGLEFPIVYLPFLWEPGYIPPGDNPVFFHDPDAGDTRSIDVSLAGTEYETHKQQSLVEQRGEDLRLAYVALTRAKHQAVIWWAGSWDSRNSPLGRLLFSRDSDGVIPAAGHSTPDDAAAGERFKALAAEAPGCVSVERSELGSPTKWTPPPTEQATLAAAVFDRGLDWHWRRTSYSDITTGASEQRIASEPEEDPLTDESTATTPPPGSTSAQDEDLAAPSLLADMPVGARIGTFIHSVLEATDFAAADLDAELTRQVEIEQGRSPLEIGDPAAVVTGLRAAIETPLGPELDGLSMRDVGRQDRLDELEFELPLAGGDEPAGELALSSIGALLRAKLAADDPLVDYADRLSDLGLRRTVRGFLTGIIDVVVRVPGSEGVPRFAILDYKTNWLGAPGETLTAWHHRPSALATEMQNNHYGLQVLLYTVALHRYLRWRLPAYDPERNLAGVFYLFVRGMLGPDTPKVDGAPCGVFGWRPSAALVEELSEVLDGREPA